MKKILICVSLFAFTGIVPASSASRSKPANPFLPATIEQVEKLQVVEPPYSGGDNPSDAPLQSVFYAYQVAVHTTCNTYVARYESPYDYFPEAFAASHEIPVQVEKGFVNFDLGFRQMRMAIIRHKTDKDPSCHAMRK